MANALDRTQGIEPRVQTMNMTLQLREIVTNESIACSELPAIIGRDATADIQLNDPTLPPYLCMIGEQGNDGAVVWSLRDDFPLYVNGSRVARAELFSGDILTLGQNRFVFSCDDALRRPPLQF